MTRGIRLAALLVCALVTGRSGAAAQGVTTSSITGTVRVANGGPLTGATVRALHQPSGTAYTTTTRPGGRFTLPGMRVGGPYRITATASGYQAQVRENVNLTLGVAADLRFSLTAAGAVALQGITVTAEQRGGIISSDRTGAATQIGRQTIEVLPTITNRLQDITRLTPQYSGNNSFAGQDNRLNNITVDGSYFNNSFGLGSQPGERTGVAPISLDAVEQVQVSIAPFDVRQGNFVGANVNTVTRSGTNQLRGSLVTRVRNEEFMGTQARNTRFDPGTFDYNLYGGWLSGPIIRNKLFFFVNLENENFTQPGTTFLANPGGVAPSGNITRVRANSLDSLRSFLSSNFGYETGPYQGYTGETPATRFLARLDYNLNEQNRISLRYNHLDSKTDVLASNSSSLGFGSRRSSVRALNFQNSNYLINENIRSLVGEWNSNFGDGFANQLIAGYTSQDESRESRGDFFPLVDILEAGQTYTSFGFEPFTPNNELRYSSLQLQNNFSFTRGDHDLTVGVQGERYESENVFFPGSQSVYVYNSLADFYRDANDYLANRNRTTSPVTLRRFQVRYSNIPGQEKPIQPLEVLYTGVYAQDQWRMRDNLTLTLGARVDVPIFGETGFRNEQANALRFRDENGNTVQYRTEKLPDANPLFSPRLGFNWDVRGDRASQLRGGTGIFTGRPAFVWISNQIGENGILTGFEQLDATRNRPFNPDPNRYKPAEVRGTPAASYGLAVTDPNYRFPQVWRSNLAIDQRLPFGFVATGEALYGRDVNQTYYINANLPAANAAFIGPDNRPRWTAGNRINRNITSAIVLKNQDEGYSYNLSATLERPFRGGTYVKGGYSYGETRNTVDPGFIAFGSWVNNPHPGDPNNPGLGLSANSQGHRVFGSASVRREYFRIGSTTVSLFVDRFAGGRASYVFSGDVNGDGGFSNDLIYVPRDASEMNFQTYTVGSGASARTVTAAQQAAAFETYIQRNEYLRSRRGEYAERNGATLPAVVRADVSFTQELFTRVAGRRNGVQLRIDVLNFGNLLNEQWGVGQRFASVRPLIVPASSQGGPADASGRIQYRLSSDILATGREPVTNAFEYSANPSDVYRFQVGLRYTFN